MTNNRYTRLFVTPAIAAALALALVLQPSAAAEVAQAARDDNGFLVHTVECEYQSGKTEIRVLLPDNLEEGKRMPVLYVLPVEAAAGTHWGDGLLKVKKADLHNKHGLICVAPTFSHLPWYTDHPTDMTIRQETYFLKAVVPFVERNYPALDKPGGRMLVGFSKSGWGAFTLLLRHPEFFGKAAAWDAPLMQKKPNRFGMGPIFGTQKNFEEYEIVRLLKQQAGKLGSEVRLIHLGYGNFREHHEQAESLMTELRIPHVYRDGPNRKHAWGSGWIPEAVELLVQPEMP